LQQKSVADFSMNNGRENRNNGNQEKGKEEKEALTSVNNESQKGGRRKRPLSFCAEGQMRRLAGLRAIHKDRSAKIIRLINPAMSA
jgi:hypothetical protein